jgi:hypothetical protein
VNDAPRMTRIIIIIMMMPAPGRGGGRGGVETGVAPEAFSRMRASGEGSMLMSRG